MAEFPPSSDMVEFTVSGDKIGMYCLICGAPLPESVNYLNEAIVAWRNHRSTQRSTQRSKHR